MPTIMSSSTKRKNKPLKSSNRSKLSTQNSLPSGEGAYTNPRLMHTVLSLMGSKCSVQVKNGMIYQGIFHTANPTMDIVLGAAHLQESTDNGVKSVHSTLSTSPLPSSNKLIDELIFKSNDVVCAVFQDVDLKSAEVPIKSNGDAPHETSLSPANGDPTRTLEPWDGGGDASADADIGGLEDDLPTTAGQNGGWCPEDMFQTNSRRYGVKTSYNPSLPEYTTKLPEDDSEEYKKRKARATQLANEMEKSPSYQKRINLELEDNQTEEEKFSSVVRDGSSSAPRSDRSRMERSDRPDRFPRARGRGKDTSGGRMGYSNYMGPGGMQRSQPSYVPRERANTPTHPSESPTSPGSGKSFSKTPISQQSLPPRFTKGHGGGGMYRDEDRINKPHDPSYQSAYNANQQPKPQRQGSSSSRNYQRNHPSPTSEYSSSQTVSETSSGRNTPQQSLSRNSSASSGTQQQVASPQWGNKPMGGPPTEVPHPSAPQAPPGPNPMSVRPRYPTGNKEMLRQTVQRKHIVPRILGRPPQPQTERGQAHERNLNKSDMSYSSALRSSGSANKGPPTMQPPYTENRMRQPYPTAATVHNVGQNTKFVYSVRGQTPPTAAQSTTPVQPPRDIHQQAVHPLQQNQSQVSPRPQLSSAPPQQAIPQYPVPVKAPAEGGKAPTKVLTKKNSEGISHSRESDSGRNTMEELKAFQTNFRLEQKPSGGDANKQQIGGNMQNKPMLSGNKQHSYSKPRTPSAQPLNRIQTPQESAAAGTQIQQTSVAPVSQPPPSQPGMTVPPPQPIQVVQQSPAPGQPMPQMQVAPQNMSQPPPATHAHMPHQSMESVEGGILPHQPVLLLSGPGTGPMMIQQMPQQMTQQMPPPVPILQAVEQPQPAINIHSPRSSSVGPAVNTVSAATGFVSPQHGGISSASDQPLQQQHSGATQQQIPSEAVVAPSSSSGDVGTAPPRGEQTGGQPALGSSATSEASPDSHQLNPEAPLFKPRTFSKPSGSTTPNSPTQVTYQHGTSAPISYMYRPTYTKALVGQTPPTIISPSGNDPPVVSHHMTQTIQTIGGPQYQTQYILAPNAHHIPGQAGVMAQPYQEMGQMVYQGHMVPTTPRAVYPNEPSMYPNYVFPQPAPQQAVQPGQQPQHPHQHQPPQQQQQQQQQQQPQQAPPTQQQTQNQPTQQSHMAQGAYIQPQPRPHSAHTPNQALPPTSPATMQQPTQPTGVVPPPMHPPSQNAMIATPHAFYPQPMIGHSMHGAPAMVPSSPHGYATQINPARYMMIQGNTPIAHSPNQAAQQAYVPQNVATSAPNHPQQYTPRQGYQ